MPKSHHDFAAIKALSRIKSFRIAGVRINLRDELAVDAGNLSKEFEHQTERAGFWRYKRAVALRKLQRSESELEELEATRFIQYLNLYNQKGETYTDFLIKQEVRCDERVIEKREEVLIARNQFQILDAICVAFEHRKSSLISLGAEQRDERPLSV